MKITKLIFLLLFITVFFACAKKEKPKPKPKPKPKYHTFIYKPEKKVDRVFVAGDFNSWSTNDYSFEMKKKDGKYFLKIDYKQLKQGKNLYVFVVDGEWMVDPNAASTENRGVGGKVGVFYIKF